MKIFAQCPVIGHIICIISYDSYHSGTYHMDYIIWTTSYGTYRMDHMIRSISYDQYGLLWISWRRLQFEGGQFQVRLIDEFLRIQIPGRRPPQRFWLKDPPSVPWNTVLQSVLLSVRKNASSLSRYVCNINISFARGLPSPTVILSFHW